MAPRVIEWRRLPKDPEQSAREVVLDVHPRPPTAAQLGQQVQRQPAIFAGAGLLLLAAILLAWWGARRPMAEVVVHGAVPPAAAPPERETGAFKRLAWTGLMAAASALATLAARRLGRLVWEKALHEAPPRK